MKNIIEEGVGLFFNLLSKKTLKKVLVIESDDWGSIRMNSKDAFDILVNKGHAVTKNPYHSLDGLEKTQDVHKLLDVLSGFKDSKGNHACMTLNYLSANPDFDKIRMNGFSAYERQSIKETYKEYDSSEDTISIVKKGEKVGVFNVQFHGNEHLNVKRWMSSLKKGDRKVIEAFDQRVFSPAIAEDFGYSMEFMDALDLDDEKELKDQLKYLNIGLDLFEEIWHKKPSSFIAPCYRWSSSIEKKLSEKGIRTIQGQRAQLHPLNSQGYKQKKIYHYTGQQNNFGQIYTVRNVVFEPSIDGVDFSLNRAKKLIISAFNVGAPVIISTHRINYTSRIDEQNSLQGLEALKKLLTWVSSSFEDLEYHSSESLTNIFLK